MCVRPDGPETDSDVFPVFLKDFSQVHGQRFKDETEMLLVKEVSVKPQTVVLVVRIGLVQSSQQFEFF